MSTQKRYRPQEIDDIEDRMGSIEQLDFDKQNESRKGRVGDLKPAEQIQREQPAKRVREAGQSGGETLGTGDIEDGVSLDDLSPETLIDESGARSASEPGGKTAADWDLSIVDEEDIGEGYGLDEAELAHVKPLDGKRWDK
ncbi:MAG: phosphotransferase system, HPr-related protein [Pseudomonas sp.]